LQGVVFRLPAPVRTEQLFRSYAVVETQTGRAVAAPRTAHVMTMPTRPLPAGTPLQPIAGPRQGTPVARIGVRPLADGSGYLVVAVTPDTARPGDLRVTVARVEGAPAVAESLEQVAEI